MQIIYGTHAYSAFRLEKLLTELKAICVAVMSIKAQYVYFIEEKTAAINNEILPQLLNDDSTYASQAEANEAAILVIPRIGTISPWSSKATDIAHVCGLFNVSRIERGIVYYIHVKEGLSQELLQQLADKLHDKMTESVLFELSQAEKLFAQHTPKPLTTIPVLDEGKSALIKADKTLGLALSPIEMDYLCACFTALGRDPSDAELMMFAQINSEHCRHKIFNAHWIIDGKEEKYTLFDMIRNTHKQNPRGDLIAYNDNGAVIKGGRANNFFAAVENKQYTHHIEDVHTVIKVETHNHPTAISPFSGAATGAGGEIRDEGATGRGAKPKAGLVGYSVSNLHIPGFVQPWEINHGKPKHFASALDIMLQAPIGAAAFNNEFGRPNLCGYFRTLELRVQGTYEEEIRGYHKPIMIAGGIGTIRAHCLLKQPLPEATKIIVLGGPAMAIGLGGGAASSATGGSKHADLDFASVQRSNPEMQRRAQEVLNTCWAMGAENPIISIHDVGAGGLSNALPELVDGSDRGGCFQLRAIPNDELGMSPAEIWCNEAQERYVLGIAEKNLPLFKKIAKRECCPFAVVGEVMADQSLTVHDEYFDNNTVDLSLGLLFGNTPKLIREVEHNTVVQKHFETAHINLHEAVQRVLQLPTVGNKSFLITIGDRSIGGLVARDQMVGPWQVPVADVAVTARDFVNYAGEAMAMGERAPIAILHQAASARMAVGEAITNIAAAYIGDISNIKLSANWMAAAGYPGEDAGLYDAVQSIGLELCPALGISIPVGKDSLSMRTTWEEKEVRHSVVSPLSLVISAFAPVIDVRKTLTAQLSQESDTDLILINLGDGCNYLGGSALAQVYNHIGYQPPDLDEPQLLKHFFAAIQQLNTENLLLAYHDRSDGGLLVTLCEMAFAGHTGISVSLDDLHVDVMHGLFNEELGAVIQIHRCDKPRTLEILQQYQLNLYIHELGSVNQEDHIIFKHKGNVIFSEPRVELQKLWTETSYRMQALRDNPTCAEQEYARMADKNDPGLQVSLTFKPDDDIAAPYIATGVRPRVAILREQGVNGHVEMAAAFDRAGFTAVDVHMSDIIDGEISLTNFTGLIACGGFSYGDVLGAGQGWAKSILFNHSVRDEFAAFFANRNTFTLGVCNGCQMLSQLTAIIPGSEHWPRFVRNKSEQFEARFSLVEIPKSPSIFMQGMAGSQLPIAIAHGEGQVQFKRLHDMHKLEQQQLVALNFIDNYGKVTEKYPENPNGSMHGIAGVTTTEGRVTILMPHPERVFRTVQNSWHPAEWDEDGPWMRMFRNARVWVG